MAGGFGNPGVPGIYSEAQVKGWRTVVDAVHARGGLIFLQLWHVGRVSHSSFQPVGALPVAPSAVPISAELKNMTADGKPASTRSRARSRPARSPASSRHSGRARAMR